MDFILSQLAFTDFAQALTATSFWQDKISSYAMPLPCYLFYLTLILIFNWFYMDQQSSKAN
jgi:hypothetical protein